MKNKVFLASLSLASLLAACQSEDFVKEQAGTSLPGRPNVKLSLSVDGADTRLDIVGNGVGFNADDELGGVIVDPTLWTVANDQAIGNNKWIYNTTTRKFETEGTTAIGSWVFYAQYNKAVTQSREGITYSFKQIQEGDATPEASTADGVDFFVSPVIMLDGFEGENMTYNVRTRSINTRALIDLSFDSSLGVKEVQKIIVKADMADNTSDQFILKGKIINTQLAVADVRSSQLGVNEDPNDVIQAATDVLGNRGAYDAVALVSNFKDITAAQSVTGATQKYLALDCIDHETGLAMPVTNGEFKSQMMLPADKYTSLTLYIYTDKGIYKKVIDNATPEAIPAVASADFYLRRGFYVNLANITLSQSDAAFATSRLSIKAANALTNAAAASETDGTVVLKTVDLVKAVEAITTNGEVAINVISDDSHKTVINKEVMDAIKEKKSQYGNLQIVFSTEMTIEGESEAAPLELQDITFNSGAKLVSGYAKITDDINIPTSQNLVVNAGATLTFAKPASAGYSYTGVQNYGTVNIDEEGTTKGIVIKAIRPNAGIFNIKSKFTSSFQFINNGTVENESEWIAESTIQNQKNITSDAALINNTGIITVTAATASNNGTINNGKADDASNNKGTINVQATFSNNSLINNYANSVIVVNGSSASALNNTASATINNYGQLFCHDGNNTINNVGKIYAKTGATTYITTNSSAAETTGTNSLTMGEIIMDGRKDDVSVTTSDQKGYISWNADEETINFVTGDKFNKLYLTGNTTISADTHVRYLVANAGTAELTLHKSIQELTFNTNCNIYANGTQIAQINIGKLTVASNVLVKVPTDNAIGVYEVDKTDSKTLAAIENKGTILVGGDFWSSLRLDQTTGNGTFASGDGNNTAFHWEKTTPWTE